MSALVESDKRNKDINYYSVKIDEMTLYIPDFISFENDTIIMETVDFRGVKYIIAKNWKVQSKSSSDIPSGDCN